MTRTELADAMIRGLHTPGVEESENNYIAVKSLINVCLACALGCALIGNHQGNFQEAEEVFDSFCEMMGDGMDLETCAGLLEIPLKLAVEIEHKHLNGMPIEQIAAWLKTSEMEVKADV